MTVDWAHAYQLHIRDTREQLQHGRRTRRPWVRLATRSIYPARLTDRQIEDLALRDAEYTLNLAINQEAEQARRRGR